MRRNSRKTGDTKSGASELNLPIAIAVCCLMWSGTTTLAQSAKQCLPVVRPPNQFSTSVKSVAVAAGDDGWSCWLTQSFLTGKDQNGTSWPNFAPTAWQRIQSQAPYWPEYHYDKTKGGADYIFPYGFDSGTRLLFYAGHGTATDWSSHDKTIRLLDVRVGDEKLRYLWQCSCDVMAHGIPIDLGAGEDYYRPLSFFYSGGGADDRRKRNVYARWESAADPGLRLACGGSSAICGNAGATTNRIWDNFLNRNFDVTDSFLEGVFNSPSGVPLCLSQGGDKINKTAIYDRDFSGDKNEAASFMGQRYLYLAYPVPFRRHGPLPVVGSHATPKLGLYPVLAVNKEQPESNSNCKDVKPDVQFSCEGQELGACFIDSKSGAEYYCGKSEFGEALPYSENRKKEHEYIEAAKNFVLARGWVVQLADIAGFSVVIERAKIGMKGNGLERYRKNAVVRFKQKFRVPFREGQVEVPVIGSGGEIVVQLNNDGKVRSATRVWRAVRDLQETKTLELLGPAQALDGLLSKLKARLSDILGLYDFREDKISFVWGYKEESGNCRQKEMRIVYQFTVKPFPGLGEKGVHPIVLEALGQTGETKEGGDRSQLDTNFCDEGLD
ncbi:MAG: hypothetical protein ABJC13_10915 [Acidobacteriota bacterium]